jgi:hypothetical protein
MKKVKLLLKKERREKDSISLWRVKLLLLKDLLNKKILFMNIEKMIISENWLY